MGINADDFIVIDWDADARNVYRSREYEGVINERYRFERYGTVGEYNWRLEMGM